MNLDTVDAKVATMPTIIRPLRFNHWALIYDKLLLVAMLLAGYYADGPFLSYPSLPFKVKTPIVVAGNWLLLDATRCNSDSETRNYLSSHRFVSDDNPPNPSYIMNTGEVPIDPGCNTEVSAFNKTPKEMAPGKYHVEGLAEVHGYVRRSDVKWRSESFIVVAAPKAP